MGNFAELERAAASVDAVNKEFPGDEPPVIETSETQQVDGGGEPVDASPAMPEKADDARQVPELDDPSDQAISIEDLLGLGGKAEDAEQTKEETQPEPETGESASPDAADPQTGYDDRIKELSASNKALKEQVDLLTKRALQEPVAADEVQGDPEKPELNDDIKEYMSPYIRDELGFDPKELKAENDRLRKVTEPLIKQAEEREMAEGISQYVEGFKPEHIKELKVAVDGMNEEDRTKYGQDFVGAVALAKDLMSRGALSGSKKKKKSTSLLAARTHTEGSGSTSLPNAGLSEQQQLERLNSMSGEQVRAFLDRLEG